MSYISALEHPAVAPIFDPFLYVDNDFDYGLPLPSVSSFEQTAVAAINYPNPKSYDLSCSASVIPFIFITMYAEPLAFSLF
jgi:hypothetical protein